MIQIAMSVMGPKGPYATDENYRYLKEAGFDGVDASFSFLMQPEINHMQRKALFDGSEKDLIDVCRPWKEAAKKYGLENFQTHAPFPTHQPYQDGGYNEYLMEVLRKMIIASDSIGCHRIVVHPFFHQYEAIESQQAEWERNIERYSRLIPTAQRYGVTVCLENMFTVNRGHVYAACCSDMGMTCDMIDELNRIAGERRFGFCFDTGHLNLCGIDIKNAMTALGERIECFHIHDNDGRSDLHRPAYNGIIDWQRFIDGLREIRFDKPISFETGSVWGTCDHAIVPAVLKLIAKTGRFFAEQATK